MTARPSLSTSPLVGTPDTLPPLKWQLPLALFLLTVGSLFWAGAALVSAPPTLPWWQRCMAGWTFAVPLLTILLCHEAGHYVAARIHKVPASLPFFIPLPVVSPFGTMGAVILMKGRIRSARALLDIGAAGPLAGMVVAVVTMVIGLIFSPVLPRSTGSYIQEGQSLLYIALKWMVLGPIPSTHDVVLHPTALAAWVGFLMTFLNLLPFAQLDGGHVAYALLGPRHNWYSRSMWAVPLFMLGLNAWLFASEAISTAFARGPSAVSDAALAPAISSTSVWFSLFIVIMVMRRTSGATHPPVDDATLDGTRRTVGIITLVLLVLLFMPAPLVQH
jgi:membrane-associated protease RseP (regulator of RpoE activity)